MSNLGLEQYLNKLGLQFYRTHVGDRYIIKKMLQSNAILGGEPSGHIIFSRHATTGDGALAALKLIECSLYYKKSVSQLFEDMTLFPQIIKIPKSGLKFPLRR